MASKSLHETSSASDKLPFVKTDLHRQATSHFTVRVGSDRKYADSDFVKPHESNAHLNLSHVLIADQPEPVSAGSFHGAKAKTSLSETLIHQKTVASSKSSSDDEEMVTTQSASTSALTFLKDDQGDKIIRFPQSLAHNEEVSARVSNTSPDDTSIHSKDSLSWSSISPEEETPPVTYPHEGAVGPAQTKAPPRNLWDMLRVGQFAMRRNALVDIVDQVKEANVKLAAENRNGYLNEELEAQKSVEAELEKASSDQHEGVEVDLLQVTQPASKDSSDQMQGTITGEITEEVKEAKIASKNSGVFDEPKSSTPDFLKSSGSAELHAGASAKSFDTVVSEFEIFDMELAGEDVDGTMVYDGTESADDQATMVTGSEFENKDSSATTKATGSHEKYDRVSSVDTVVPQDTTILYQGDMGATTQDGNYLEEERESGAIYSKGQLKLRGRSRSESSVEVISDLKKDSSSLDGLAIAEERQSIENTLIQEPIPNIDNYEKSSEALSRLQAELKASQEETIKLQQQLDLQVTCEEFLRKEAVEEIRTAERKIKRLQAQIRKPPKLIRKYRKKLRRIFQEIEAEGGPKKVGASADGLQHAIRFLYLKLKDTEKLIQEKEKQLQITQAESISWETRAKEQEAAKLQLMNDLEECKYDKATQIGASTMSQSDTRLSYGSMQQKFVPSDISWGMKEHTPSKQTFVDQIDVLKIENSQLRQQLLDVQAQAQTQRLESKELKLHAELIKSQMNALNDELIMERLHSQHLSTKLHSYEVSTKNSMLWGMAEKLDVATPPIEEAVTTLGCATVEDIEGLEDWLGHLKAGQQHAMSELDRHNQIVQTLHAKIEDVTNSQIQHKDLSDKQTSEMKQLVDAGKQMFDDLQQMCNNHLKEDHTPDKDKLLQTLHAKIEEVNNWQLQHKVCQELSEKQTSEMKQLVDAGKQMLDDLQQKCTNHLKEDHTPDKDKLWQELCQLRDVQLETVTDLENKDCKISELQHGYSKLVAEQLQQRAKLEMDLADNRSEKKEIQEELEETKQLVTELHRKCVQLSQALEESQHTIAKQTKDIQDLKDYFTNTMKNKEEEMKAMNQNNLKEMEVLKKQLLHLEAKTREMMSTEGRLNEELALFAHENTLLQKKNSISARLGEKLNIIENELEEIREVELQVRTKYATQDKEIHHLHHNMSVIQTEMQRQIEQMVNTALVGCQEERDVLEAQLTKAITAHQNSEQNRKTVEDDNKILMKKTEQLETNCNRLTHQLQKEWIGHQKTEDKLHNMQTMLGQESQTKLQMYSDHEDLSDWEEQLKEEGQRLSAQLHRILGNHDTQHRHPRQTNLQINGVPQLSYHDNVSSGRSKLQVLLNSARPQSAMPYLHHNTDTRMPYEGAFTRARRLETPIDESQTMSRALLAGQRPPPFSSYTESCQFASYPPERSQ